MVKYKKKISSGVLRIPQEVREAFGNDVVLQPNLKSAVLFPANEDRRKVIRSLQLIIRDLKQEVEEQEEQKEAKK